MPKINKEECTGCGVCITKCPAGAISIDKDNKAEIDIDKCRKCGACINACPVQAITKGV